MSAVALLSLAAVRGTPVWAQSGAADPTLSASAAATFSSPEAPLSTRTVRVPYWKFPRNPELR